MGCRVRAVFVRGGTSRALVFHARDLPERAAWDPIFLAALGSPDPYGRQLDGLGGGISSLSKVAVVGPPTHPDADVDYTFGQVEVSRPVVDYRGNCGNISSAIGPFAIDEGLVAAEAPLTRVRIHNTNTRKLIHARVPVEGGRAAVHGDFALDGVPGTGARIALDFLDPGGAVTGRLLPTGAARDVLDVPGLGALAASLVDATTPLAVVRAKDLEIEATERPEELDARPGLPERLEAVRAAAAVRMGLAATAAEATRESAAVPKLAVVFPPTAYRTLAGAPVEPDAVDLVARIVSMGKVHRAFALTGAMGLAVAVRIPGTLAHEAASGGHAAGDVRIGHPSGVLPVAAEVARRPDGALVARTVTVYRTARRLMEGFVHVP
ncbi:MAG TPA: PrpF domain-containing protein [Methylomirabilota bacterium]|jgi:2-methylaconitate cis-trans-isomerase PrpF|nr:PrpF domain-containing protein [Methylomirabilota bacterium]